jgi:hypothetical protein
MLQKGTYFRLLLFIIFLLFIFILQEKGEG